MSGSTRASGARMVLLILCAAALSLAWGLASVRTARAEIFGPGSCGATLNGVDVAGVDSGNRGDDISVRQHDIVPVTMTSAKGFKSHKIQLEFGGQRRTVSSKTDDGSHDLLGQRQHRRLRHVRRRSLQGRRRRDAHRWHEVRRRGHGRRQRQSARNGRRRRRGRHGRRRHGRRSRGRRARGRQPRQRRHRRRDRVRRGRAHATRVAGSVHLHLPLPALPALAMEHAWLLRGVTNDAVNAAVHGRHRRRRRSGTGTGRRAATLPAHALGAAHHAPGRRQRPACRPRRRCPIAAVLDRIPDAGGDHPRRRRRRGRLRARCCRRWGARSPSVASTDGSTLWSGPGRPAEKGPFAGLTATRGRWYDRACVSECSLANSERPCSLGHVDSRQTSAGARSSIAPAASLPRRATPASAPPTSRRRPASPSPASTVTSPARKSSSSPPSGRRGRASSRSGRRSPATTRTQSSRCGRSASTTTTTSSRTPPT